MDVKEESLIKSYHSMLVNSSFSERDVLGLLIILRGFSRIGSPVHEFSNFIAHRERDRGVIFDYLNRSKSQIDNFTARKANLNLEIYPVFTEGQIKDSLNQIFTRLGFGPISDQSARGFTFCIISLLQHVKIVNNAGIESGELLFGYNRDEINLFGKFVSQNYEGESIFIIIPVLTIPNDYLTVSEEKFQTPDIIEVINENDTFKIIELPLNQSL